MSNEKKDIRLIDSEGNVIEVKKVEFKRERLSYKMRIELKRMANILKYAEVDPLSVKEDEEASFKTLDMEAWQNAREDANIELTRVIWGITNIKLDIIIAEDFEELMNYTIEKDLVGFKKSEDEVKKKLKDNKRKGSLNSLA